MAGTAVILVSGAPASGKSFVAGVVAAELGIPLVAKDTLKEALYETLGTGDVAWSQALGGAAYELLYSALEIQLRAGRSVILEANFHVDHARPRLAGLRDEYGFEPLEIHCTAATATLLERYTARGPSRHPGHADGFRLDDLAAALARGTNGALELGGSLVVLDTTDLESLDLRHTLAAAEHHSERRAETPVGSPRASSRAPARDDPRAIVLVEGESDRIALETLAARLGRDLADDGVAVLPTGGVHAIGRFLSRFGPSGLDVRLAGLCDEGEAHVVRRSLGVAGFGVDLTREAMEGLGFYVCSADLEDELVRALGPNRVEQVIDAEGEIRSFRTFQKQIAKRGLSHEEQLWRFMWNRKVRYAAVLVDALDLEHVPRSLVRVLSHV